MKLVQVRALKPIKTHNNEFYSFFNKHSYLQTTAKQMAYNKSVENVETIKSIAKIEKMYQDELIVLKNEVIFNLSWV